MTKFSALLAQAAPAPGGGASGTFQFLFFVFMMAAMYFLLIAPQRKKQKEHEKMMAALKTGDEIVTTGGIYGVISGIKEDRLIVRIGDNNLKVEVAKGFVHGLVKKSDA